MDSFSFDLFTTSFKGFKTCLIAYNPITSYSCSPVIAVIAYSSNFESFITSKAYFSSYHIDPVVMFS